MRRWRAAAWKPRVPSGTSGARGSNRGAHDRRRPPHSAPDTEQPDSRRDSQPSALLALPVLACDVRRELQ